MKNKISVLLVAVLVLALAQKISAQETDYDTVQESSSYFVKASAEGYESGSIQVTAASADLVELRLFKKGSENSGSKPIKNVEIKNPITSGEDSTRSAPDIPSGVSQSTALKVPTETESATEASASIDIDKKTISITATENKETPINEKIVIKNTGELGTSLNMRIEGFSDLLVSPTRLVLSSKGTQGETFVKGEISKIKAGVYTAKLFIRSDDGKIYREVPVIVNVKPANILFDLLLSLDFSNKTSVTAGEDVPIRIKAINIAGQKFEVNLRYKLGEASGPPIFSTEEKITGGPTAEFKRSVKTRPDMAAGTYIIDAQIVDKGEVVATAATTVYINGKVIGKGDMVLGLIALVAIAVGGSLASLFYFKKDLLKNLLSGILKKKGK